MMLKPRGYFTKLISALGLYIFLAGCAASYQVRDVIDLPPPRQVHAERHQQQVMIRWRPGQETRAKKFSGYLLFKATRSLINTPVRELPPAIELPDTTSSFAFVSTDTVKLFIHVRSRTGKRKISLPSLPEVIVLPE